MRGDPRVGSSPTPGTDDRRHMSSNPSSPTERLSRRTPWSRSTWNGLLIAASARRRYPAGVSERVLVVDDDDAVRQVVVEALSDAGYECIGARDGMEGLR